MGLTTIMKPLYTQCMEEMTILQIPIKKDFRDKLLKVVREMGFSSLQDYTRFLLKKTLEGKLEVKVVYKDN